MLGELYKQALEAKGYTVKLKKNIGSTEIIDKALTSHQIDGYPEYLGVSVAVVAGKDIIPKSDQETYDLAKQFYEGRGQTISQQTPFFDVDAIATTKDFATKNSLKSVADLKKLDSFTVGARPEFKSRYQGLKGMQKVYGLTNAQFKQLALGIQYQALDKGDVDRRTCSPRTPSWRAASTRCSRTRRGSSATSTWRWSSTRRRTTPSGRSSSRPSTACRSCSRTTR